MSEARLVSGLPPDSDTMRRAADGANVIPFDANAIRLPTPTTTRSPTSAPADPSGYPTGLDQDIIKLEGSGPNAVSPKGAIGTNQIMPATGARYGYTPEQLHDPNINQLVGDRYRRDLWARYKDPTAVKVAYNAGEGVADQWIKSGKDPSVLPGETQRYIGLASEQQRRMTEGSPGLQRIADETHRMFERIANMDGRDPETARLLRETREKMLEYQQKSLDVSERFFRETQPTPHDFMQRLGGIGTVIGVLGGLLTKQPLMASLNAGAAAMEAYNKQDEAQYKYHLDAFRYYNDSLRNMAQFEQNSYRDILQDERLSRSEQMNRLQMMASLLGNERMVEVARSGQDEKVMRMLFQLQQSQRNFDEKVREFDNKFAVDPKTKEAEMFSDLEEARRSGNPDAVKAALNSIADYNLSRGTRGARSAPALFMQTYMQEHPGATSTELADAMGEYRRVQSVEGGFGSGILGRQVISLNTVADHILRVEEYATALRNGQIPRANQIANRLATEMGKPEVTSFEAGRDIMADEVVRLLTSTGGTEADRQGMQSRLSAMMSPAQFAGVFDIFKGFTGARFEALRQQFAQGDPEREKYFSDRLLTPKGRQVFESISPSRSAAPGGQKYTMGQIIEKGGRRYRVTGGDMNDPDVEPVQ